MKIAFDSDHDVFTIAATPLKWIGPILDQEPTLKIHSTQSLLLVPCEGTSGNCFDSVSESDMRPCLLSNRSNEEYNSATVRPFGGSQWEIWEVITRQLSAEQGIKLRVMAGVN